MSDSALTPLAELNQTYGVLFAGFVLAVTLYGLTFFQTYIFYSRFPMENVWTKTTVGVLWAVDTATTALISHTLYFYLITNFFLSFTEIDVTKTFVAENALAAFAVLLVQLYYAARVWAVSNKQSWLTAIIALISTAAFALGIDAAAQISKQTLFYNFVTQRVKVALSINQGLASLCDFVILGALFYYLRPAYNPGMKVAQGWIEKPVVYILNRGTFFTILQVAQLLVFVPMPNKQIWVLFHWILSKVYVNSLLLTLNSRHTFRGRGLNEEESLNQQPSAKNTSSGVSSGRVGTARTMQFNVVDTKMTTTIELGEMTRQESEGDDLVDEASKHDISTIDISDRIDNKVDPGYDHV